MTSCAHVSAVSYLGERLIEVVFEDGLIRKLDFHSNWQGNLACLNRDNFLAQVGVDKIAKTLSWPNGVDLDPEVLYGSHEPAVGGDFFTVVSETKPIRT